MGGMVDVKESVSAVLLPAEGIVVAGPSAAVVNSGIGFLNASRNVGVPKVSVRAIPKTYIASN